jgi:hypothetical protein
MMKLTASMIAVAALFASSAAVAAPDAERIARMSGASAVKANFAAALNNKCVAAGGVLNEWISGGNISTYVCATSGGLTSGSTGTYATSADSAFVNFDGTSFAEVRLNVAGGSFTALQVLAGGSDRYLNPANSSTVVAAGAVNNTTATVGSGAVATEAGGIGGFSDVNYDGFAANVRATVTGLDDAVSNGYSANAGVAQGFGVAASGPLYDAMFVAQQNAGLIPAAPTCTVALTNVPACVPSISKGQMASIMSSFNGSAAKTLGAPFLAPQLAANTELRYARRVDTSGSHASALNYFLGIGNMTGALAVFADPSNRVAGTTAATSGCNIGDLRGPAATNDEIDTAFVATGQIDLCDKKQGNLRTLAAPGTGDVRNELNKTTILGGALNYALGVMSLENDQATYRNTANVSVPTTWKWLRVQGANGAENATPGGNNNRGALVAGNYDFYYELWGYVQADANGNNQALLDAIISGLNAAPLDGLTVIGSGAGQQPYNRGGRTDTPSAR